MKITVVCTIIALTLCVNVVSFAKAQGTVIAVDPPSYVTTQDQIGQPFTLNINITDVANLWSWGLRLNWDPNIVNATSVQEGPFLKTAGSTMFLPPVRGSGYLKDIASTLLSASSANGSGILCTVTFQALAVGETGIMINGTSLIASDYVTAIPAEVSNGTVIVTIPEITAPLFFVAIFVATSVVILAKKKTKAYHTE